MNKSSYPYFDDYDKSKNFHQVLFHPGKPVQARELTQMQSILQEQIKRHGDHIFKNGTMVIPGHIFYDDKIKYLKLETIYNQVNINGYLSQLKDLKIKGDTNKIEALVVHFEISNSLEPTTIFIKYTSSAGTIKEFVSGETITCADIPGLTFKVLPVTSYTGDASIATIGEGVYYVNGYFVGLSKQTITVAKYSNTASAVIGLSYEESVITENEDETLFDNAFGFTNYGAPGAHRLKIGLTLDIKDYNYVAENTAEIKFIDLLKIKNGKIEYLKNDTKYAEIEKWLARRTFEESGNYVTTPFTFSAIDFRNNDRGQWVQNTPYLIGDVVSNSGLYYLATNTGYSSVVAPTHTYGISSDGGIYWSSITNKQQFINNGLMNVASTDLNVHIGTEADMFISTSAGKGYVQGFEVEFPSPTKSIVSKARDKKQVNNTQIYAPAGSYLTIDTIRGIPNITTNLTKANLLDVSGSTVGTTWVRALEYLSGTPGTDTASYRLFIFGSLMNVGKNFHRDVHSVSVATFSANIVPTLVRLSGSLSTSGTTVTGSGTFFDYELSENNRVKIGSTWGVVSSIASPIAFTAVASYGTLTNQTAYIGITELTKLGEYVSPMPSSSIATIRNSSGNIDTQYVITKAYSFTATGTSHVITLTNGETFLPTEHIVIKNTGSLGTDIGVNATYTLNGDSTQLTIGGLTNAVSYNAFLIVKRSGSFAREKSKSLSTHTLTLNNAGTQTYASKAISLSKADCIRLIKVTESGDATDKVNYVTSGEVDITRYFSFDNGQRDEFYDLGKISTNRNCQRPIRITFEYFYHSDGDYFSVDSYSTIPRSMWPKQILGGTSYFLPDCLDFRSRIGDTGINFDTVGTGASVSSPMSSENTIGTSYSYYVGRSDTLGILNNGQMTYVIGGEVTDGMKLCDIKVNPYTYDAETEVSFASTQIENYTMEDITILDKRLSDAEYYVVLNQLERSTVETSIKDEFGLEKTKHGFVVDEFRNHEVGDIENQDYKCSLEYNEGILRSPATLETVHLIEPEGTTPSSRLSNGYMVTGSMVSLPYTEVAMISQVMASRAENVQAYSTLDFTGQLCVYPETDSFVDNLNATATRTVVGSPIHEIENVTVIRYIPTTIINTITSTVYDKTFIPYAPSAGRSRARRGGRGGGG